MKQRDTVALQVPRALHTRVKELATQRKQLIQVVTTSLLNSALDVPAAAPELPMPSSRRKAKR